MNLEKEKEYFKSLKEWTPFEIMRWSNLCFPLASAENQKARVEEEIQEYFENKKISEIADSAIATMGVGRFSMVEMHRCQLMVEECLKDAGTTPEEMQSAINEKMKINVQRWINGDWVWDMSSMQYKRGK